MAKAIFNVLFKVLVGLANLILYPINNIINTLVPNLSSAISTISDSISLFLTNSLAWGFNILPPHAKYFVGFYLAFLVLFYTISFSIHSVVWLINVIKKLPLA